MAFERRDFVRFALPPSLGTAEVLPMGKALENYLSQTLNQRAEVVVAPNYEVLAKDLLSGKVDAAWAPPFVCARVESMGARILVRGIRHGAGVYRAALVCRTQSQLTLESLNGSSAVWTDRDSVGGYLLAIALLKGMKLDPNQLFPRQTFAGSYRAALEAVSKGDSDVTSVFARAGDGDGPTGISELLPGREGEFRVVAFTEQAPNDGVAVSMGLQRSAVEGLENTFLNLPDSVEGQELLKALFNAERFESAQRLGYRALYRVALAAL